MCGPGPRAHSRRWAESRRPAPDARASASVCRMDVRTGSGSDPFLPVLEASCWGTLGDTVPHAVLGGLRPLSGRWAARARGWFLSGGTEAACWVSRGLRAGDAPSLAGDVPAHPGLPARPRAGSARDQRLLEQHGLRGGLCLWPVSGSGGPLGSRWSICLPSTQGWPGAPWAAGGGGGEGLGAQDSECPPASPGQGAAPPP